MINNKKLAFITLVGAPNAGKSTLLNNIIGEKISIVTPKAQTSRKNIKGIMNYDNAQLVFLDTPGLFAPQRKLERLIAKNTAHGIMQGDFLCAIFDARKQSFQHTIDLLKQFKLPKSKVAIINKIDLVDKQVLLSQARGLSQLNMFNRIFMISALKGDGTEDLIKHLAHNASHAEWVYNEDEITDASIRDIAEEMTREQLYLSLNKELPYSLKVETDKWDEGEKDIKIYQSIYVLKTSHKKIVIGDNAKNISRVSKIARQNIAKLVDKKIHLFLYVKVRKDWIEKQQLI